MIKPGHKILRRIQNAQQLIKEISLFAINKQQAYNKAQEMGIHEHEWILAK